MPVGVIEYGEAKLTERSMSSGLELAQATLLHPAELSEREQAFLGPFMWRMEQHFAFLGWTRSALGSRDCR